MTVKVHRSKAVKAKNPRDRRMAAHAIGIKYSQSAFNIIHMTWRVYKTRDVTYRLAAVTRCVDVKYIRNSVFDAFARCIVRDSSNN